MARNKSGFTPKWKRDAVKKILHSNEMHEINQELAEEVADKASRYGDAAKDGPAEGYLVTDLVLEKPRAASSVITSTAHSMNHNVKYHALIRAMLEVADGNHS